MSSDPKFPCSMQVNFPSLLPLPCQSTAIHLHLHHCIISPWLTQTSRPLNRQLRIPFPTPRLASTALKALQVDPELSPLVQRHVSVVSSSSSSTSPSSGDHAEVLLVEYQATTNRMLRVAVNSFMEGLKLVLEVMEQLDVDVLAAEKANPIKSP
ncbi:uncharacterized protein Triagg1_7582 [Trichoderma aggressivum f. europaeum]|uniref:Transcription factor Pcc1 n=1 Tax=Trichoderma aggressivum f. europaeum TaxID=173218 RepID=A0AAE1I928_9HYPO|nr:hypothetical protein Triagg1_7582 [Trichoderma aggressivum f. europaeum]